MASAFVTVPKAFTLSKPSVPSVSTQRLFGSPSYSLRINAVALKWKPTKVVPQADWVLIRLEQLPEKSPGGVLLGKSAVKYVRYLMGEILSVGSEVGHVEPGNKVIFSDINAYEFSGITSGSLLLIWEQKPSTVSVKRVTCWLRLNDQHSVKI